MCREAESCSALMSSVSGLAHLQLHRDSSQHLVFLGSWAFLLDQMSNQQRRKVPSWLYRLTFAVSPFHVWILGLQGEMRIKLGLREALCFWELFAGCLGFKGCTSPVPPNPACNNSMCVTLLFLLVHANGVNRYR